MAPAGDQKHNMGAAGDQIQYIRRIRGLVVSRAWLFAERRSSGVSALWLLKKSRSKRYKACSDVGGSDDIVGR